MKKLKIIGIVFLIIFGLGILGSCFSDGDNTTNYLNSSEKISSEEKSKSYATLTTEKSKNNNKTPTSETIKNNITTSSTKSTTTTQNDDYQSNYVWIPQSGKKYHSHSGCSGMKNPSKITESKAESLGYSPCSRCW